MFFATYLGRGVAVFVRKINHFPDTALDNCLGALIAGEKCCIAGTAAHRAVIGIKYSVKLSMADVKVF